VNFVNKQFIKDYFKGKRVAIFGSAPSCLENNNEYIDKFDLVIRVNNYKIKGIGFDNIAYDYTSKVGNRADVHYSFYGSSILKTAKDLFRDGVKLCMCKCPNEFLFNHDVQWDPKNMGSDFRPLYRRKKDFWFCDTYIPTKEDFMEYFHSLRGHMPTTGYACILDLVQCEPKELYITGFDGFKCGKHNVDEGWRDKRGREDPICHMPEAEIHYIKALQYYYDFIKLDRSLSEGTI